MRRVHIAECGEILSNERGQIRREAVLHVLSETVLSYLSSYKNGDMSCLPKAGS